jgi:hypothetical protein
MKDTQMKTFSITSFLVAFLSVVGLTVAVAVGAGRGGGGGTNPIPAPTLKPVDTATKAPDADGFIQRWLILEPIGVSGQLGDNTIQAEVKAEYFPNQFTVVPRDGDKVTVGGSELAWHAVDSSEFNVNLFHYARALGKRFENCVYWVVTVIDCPKEVQGARLTFGSNAGSVWWVNGKEVGGIYQSRQSNVDDGVSKRLTLKKGINVIRGAVINSTGATDFVARLLDADDNPIKDFTINLNAAAN